MWILLFLFHLFTRSFVYSEVKIIPKIATCLRDIRCCDGDSATLECKIQGTPPPDIRWEKCGKVGISGYFPFLLSTGNLNTIFCTPLYCLCTSNNKYQPLNSKIVKEFITSWLIWSKTWIPLKLLWGFNMCGRNET